MDKIKASQFADLAYYSRQRPFIPTEYQQVEYLEATGSQYINTNYTPTASDIVSGDFQLTTTTRTDNTLFYLDNGGYNIGAYGFSMTWIGGGAKGYVCGWDNAQVYSALDTNRHIVTISNGIFTLDGTVIFSSGASLSNLRAIKLFAWDRNGSVIIKGVIRVYGFYAKANANTTPYIELVPCVRKSDSKPGMYDRVSQTFMTNAGTGDFTVGNNVTYGPEV